MKRIDCLKFARRTARLLLLLLICISFGSHAWTQNIFPGPVGIGVATPISPLDVASTGIYGVIVRKDVNVAANSTDYLQLRLTGTTTFSQFLSLGDDTTAGAGIAQAGTDGVSWDKLLLNPKGGNVGIGTSNPANKLSVAGTIQAYEVVVQAGWSDYVFAPGYRLTPLNEVADYVRKNRHLPGIPSEAEVAKIGVPVGEIQSKLLAKIEELTLHMIRADERNLKLEQQNAELQQRMTRLETGSAAKKAILP